MLEKFMHSHVFLSTLSHVLNVNLRGSCYSQSEASDVIGMAPSCSRGYPQRTPQTMEEESKHRIECDGACHTTETAEQKEHRLSNPRTKDKSKACCCLA